MSYALRHAMGSLMGAPSAIPGLTELEDDFKSVYVRLTSAMAGVRFDAQQYNGLLGRIRQFAAGAGAGGVAVSAALSTGDAQQLAVSLLAHVGLAVSQAKKMESAYVAGDPNAIRLADRLVSEGRDAERIAATLATAARATSSTSGLGLTSAEATLLVGLLLGPASIGASIPIAVLLAAAQVITGMDATLTESAGLFGTPSLAMFSGILNPIKDAANHVVDNLTKPLGYVVAILAGTAAVGLVGYIAWNLYVARRAVRHVTGNRKKSKRQRRAR